MGAASNLEMTALWPESRRAADKAERSALRQRVTAVFVALRKPVYHYLVRLTGDAAEAEDLTQEAFLRLYREVARGRVVRNVRAWVFQVAHNLAADRARRGEPTLQLGEEDWKALAESAEDTGGQLEVLLDRRLRVDAALAQLSPRERRCLELRASGLRYREIAEILGVGITSVESYLVRAVAKLRSKREGRSTS